MFGQQMIATVLQQETHTVTFSPKADITIGCTMDFSSFPFDRQTCVLEMGTMQRDISLSSPGAHLMNSSAEILGFKMQVKYVAFGVKILIKRFLRGTPSQHSMQWVSHWRLRGSPGNISISISFRQVGHIARLIKKVSNINRILA